MMTTIDESILNHFGDEYQGIPLTLQALGDRQWLVVLQARPAARLRLSAESDFTKQLDKMGISDETKIGDPQLDDNYVIRAESTEARELLANPQVRHALTALTPFVELELTHKEYRLIKDGVQPTPQALESLLTPFHQLVEATKGPEGSFE
ncbi:MAG: hypothetical protein KF760_24810 [Candidatus Eremiobacteraeota bacterium]|nr:hypothetical protein [Candidatus Eremiobacteraeota bacterium]MCW5872769.1 hypothetical protein [Candidatus Eremiobacteraeota bacterium]